MYGANASSEEFWLQRGKNFEMNEKKLEENRQQQQEDEEEELKRKRGE